MKILPQYQASASRVAGDGYISKEELPQLKEVITAFVKKTYTKAGADQVSRIVNEIIEGKMSTENQVKVFKALMDVISRTNKKDIADRWLASEILKANGISVAEADDNKSVSKKLLDVLMFAAIEELKNNPPPLCEIWKQASGLIARHVEESYGIKIKSAEDLLSANDTGKINLGTSSGKITEQALKDCIAEMQKGPPPTWKLWSRSQAEIIAYVNDKYGVTITSAEELLQANNAGKLAANSNATQIDESLFRACLKEMKDNPPPLWKIWNEQGAAVKAYAKNVYGLNIDSAEGLMEAENTGLLRNNSAVSEVSSATVVRGQYDAAVRHPIVFVKLKMWEEFSDDQKKSGQVIAFTDDPYADLTAPEGAISDSFTTDDILNMARYFSVDGGFTLDGKYQEFLQSFIIGNFQVIYNELKNVGLAADLPPVLQGSNINNSKYFSLALHKLQVFILENYFPEVYKKVQALYGTETFDFTTLYINCLSSLNPEDIPGPAKQLINTYLQIYGALKQAKDEYINALANNPVHSFFTSQERASMEAFAAKYPGKKLTWDEIYSEKSSNPVYAALYRLWDWKARGVANQSAFLGSSNPLREDQQPQNLQLRQMLVKYYIENGCLKVFYNKVIEVIGQRTESTKSLVDSGVAKLIKNLFESLGLTVSDDEGKFAGEKLVLFFSNQVGVHVFFTMFREGKIDLESLLKILSQFSGRELNVSNQEDVLLAQNLIQGMYDIINKETDIARQFVASVGNQSSISGLLKSISGQLTTDKFITKDFILWARSKYKGDFSVQGQGLFLNGDFLLRGFDSLVPGIEGLLSSEIEAVQKYKDIFGDFVKDHVDQLDYSIVSYPMINKAWRQSQGYLTMGYSMENPELRFRMFVKNQLLSSTGFAGICWAFGDNLPFYICNNKTMAKFIALLESLVLNKDAQDKLTAVKAKFKNNYSEVLNDSDFKTLILLIRGTAAGNAVAKEFGVGNFYDVVTLTEVRAIRDYVSKANQGMPTSLGNKVLAYLESVLENPDKYENGIVNLEVADINQFLFNSKEQAIRVGSDNAQDVSGYKSGIAGDIIEDFKSLLPSDLPGGVGEMKTQFMEFLNSLTSGQLDALQVTMGMTAVPREYFKQYFLTSISLMVGMPYAIYIGGPVKVTGMVADSIAGDQKWDKALVEITKTLFLFFLYRSFAPIWYKQAKEAWDREDYVQAYAMFLVTNMLVSRGGWNSVLGRTLGFDKEVYKLIEKIPGARQLIASMNERYLTMDPQQRSKFSTVVFEYIAKKGIVRSMVEDVFGQLKWVQDTKNGIDSSKVAQVSIKTLRFFFGDGPIGVLLDGEATSDQKLKKAAQDANKQFMDILRLGGALPALVYSKIADNPVVTQINKAQKNKTANSYLDGVRLDQDNLNEEAKEFGRRSYQNGCAEVASGAGVVAGMKLDNGYLDPMYIGTSPHHLGSIANNALLYQLMFDYKNHVEIDGIKYRVRKNAQGGLEFYGKEVGPELIISPEDVVGESGKKKIREHFGSKAPRILELANNVLKNGSSLLSQWLSADGQLKVKVKINGQEQEVLVKEIEIVSKGKTSLSVKSVNRLAIDYWDGVLQVSMEDIELASRQPELWASRLSVLAGSELKPLNPTEAKRSAGIKYEKTKSDEILRKYEPEASRIIDRYKEISSKYDFRIAKDAERFQKDFNSEYQKFMDELKTRKYSAEELQIKFNQFRAWEMTAIQLASGTKNVQLYKEQLMAMMAFSETGVNTFQQIGTGQGKTVIATLALMEKAMLVNCGHYESDLGKCAYFLTSNDDLVGQFLNPKDNYALKLCDWLNITYGGITQGMDSEAGKKVYGKDIVIGASTLISDMGAGMYQVEVPAERRSIKELKQKGVIRQGNVTFDEVDALLILQARINIIISSSAQGDNPLQALWDRTFKNKAGWEKALKAFTVLYNEKDFSKYFDVIEEGGGEKSHVLNSQGREAILRAMNQLPKRIKEMTDIEYQKAIDIAFDNHKAGDLERIENIMKAWHVVDMLEGKDLEGGTIKEHRVIIENGKILFISEEGQPQKDMVYGGGMDEAMAVVLGARGKNALMRTLFDKKALPKIAFPDKHYTSADVNIFHFLAFNRMRISGMSGSIQLMEDIFRMIYDNPEFIKQYGFEKAENRMLVMPSAIKEVKIYTETKDRIPVLVLDDGTEIRGDSKKNIQKIAKLVFEKMQEIHQEGVLVGTKTQLKIRMFGEAIEANDALKQIMVELSGLQKTYLDEKGIKTDGLFAVVHEMDPIVVNTVEQKIQEIARDAINNAFENVRWSNDGKLISIGEPRQTVLATCENINLVDAVTKKIAGYLHEYADAKGLKYEKVDHYVQEITARDTQKEFDSKLAKAKQKGMITVNTRIQRGINHQGEPISSWTVRTGALDELIVEGVKRGNTHVIVSGINDFEALEIQIKGRGPREDKPGSMRVVFSLSEELFVGYGKDDPARINELQQMKKALGLDDGKTVSREIKYGSKEWQVLYGKNGHSGTIKNVRDFQLQSLASQILVINDESLIDYKLTSEYSIWRNSMHDGPHGVIKKVSYYMLDHYLRAKGVGNFEIITAGNIKDIHKFLKEKFNFDTIDLTALVGQKRDVALEAITRKIQSKFLQRYPEKYIDAEVSFYEMMRIFMDENTKYLTDRDAIKKEESSKFSPDSESARDSKWSRMDAAFSKMLSSLGDRVVSTYFAKGPKKWFKKAVNLSPVYTFSIEQNDLKKAGIIVEEKTKVSLIETEENKLSAKNLQAEEQAGICFRSQTEGQYKLDIISKENTIYLEGIKDPVQLNRAITEFNRLITWAKQRGLDYSSMKLGEFLKIAKSGVTDSASYKLLVDSGKNSLEMLMSNIYALTSKELKGEAKHKTQIYSEYVSRQYPERFYEVVGFHTHTAGDISDKALGTDSKLHNEIVYARTKSGELIYRRIQNPISEIGMESSSRNRVRENFEIGDKAAIILAYDPAKHVSHVSSLAGLPAEKIINFQDIKVNSYVIAPEDIDVLKRVSSLNSQLTEHIEKLVEVYGRDWFEQNKESFYAEFYKTVALNAHNLEQMKEIAFNIGGKDVSIPITDQGFLKGISPDIISAAQARICTAFLNANPDLIGKVDTALVLEYSSRNYDANGHHVAEGYLLNEMISVEEARQYLSSKQRSITLENINREAVISATKDLATEQRIVLKDTPVVLPGVIRQEIMRIVWLESFKQKITESIIHDLFSKNPDVIPNAADVAQAIEKILTDGKIPAEIVVGGIKYSFNENMIAGFEEMLKYSKDSKNLDQKLTELYKLKKPNATALEIAGFVERTKQTYFKELQKTYPAEHAFWSYPDGLLATQDIRKEMEAASRLVSGKDSITGLTDYLNVQETTVYEAKSKYFRFISLGKDQNGNIVFAEVDRKVYEEYLKSGQNEAEIVRALREVAIKSGIAPEGLDSLLRAEKEGEIFNNNYNRIYQKSLIDLGKEILRRKFSELASKGLSPQEVEKQYREFKEKILPTVLDQYRQGLVLEVGEGTRKAGIDSETRYLSEKEILEKAQVLSEKLLKELEADKYSNEECFKRYQAFQQEYAERLRGFTETIIANDRVSQTLDTLPKGDQRVLDTLKRWYRVVGLQAEIDPKVLASTRQGLVAGATYKFASGALAGLMVNTLMAAGSLIGKEQITAEDLLAKGKEIAHGTFMMARMQAGAFVVQGFTGMSMGSALNLMPLLMSMQMFNQAAYIESTQDRNSLTAQGLMNWMFFTDAGMFLWSKGGLTSKIPLVKRNPLAGGAVNQLAMAAVMLGGMKLTEAIVGDKNFQQLMSHKDTAVVLNGIRLAADTYYAGAALGLWDIGKIARALKLAKTADNIYDGVKATSYAARWGTRLLTAGGAAAADGPIPVGEVVGLVILLGSLAVDGANAASNIFADEQTSALKTYMLQEKKKNSNDSKLYWVGDLMGINELVVNSQIFGDELLRDISAKPLSARNVAMAIAFPQAALGLGIATLIDNGGAEKRIYERWGKYYNSMYSTTISLNKVLAEQYYTSEKHSGGAISGSMYTTDLLPTGSRPLTKANPYLNYKPKELENELKQWQEELFRTYVGLFPEILNILGKYDLLSGKDSLKSSINLDPNGNINLEAVLKKIYPAPDLFPSIEDLAAYSGKKLSHEDYASYRRNPYAFVASLVISGEAKELDDKNRVCSFILYCLTLNQNDRGVKDFIERKKDTFKMIEGQWRTLGSIYQALPWVGTIEAIQKTAGGEYEKKKYHIVDINGNKKELTVGQVIKQYFEGNISGAEYERVIWSVTTDGLEKKAAFLMERRTSRMLEIFNLQLTGRYKVVKEDIDAGLVDRNGRPLQDKEQVSWLRDQLSALEKKQKITPEIQSKIETLRWLIKKYEEPNTAGVYSKASANLLGQASKENIDYATAVKITRAMLVLPYKYVREYVLKKLATEDFVLTGEFKTLMSKLDQTSDPEVRRQYIDMFVSSSQNYLRKVSAYDIAKRDSSEYTEVKGVLYYVDRKDGQVKRVVRDSSKVESLPNYVLVGATYNFSSNKNVYECGNESIAKAIKNILEIPGIICEVVDGRITFSGNIYSQFERAYISYYLDLKTGDWGIIKQPTFNGMQQAISTNQYLDSSRLMGSITKYLETIRLISKTEVVSSKKAMPTYINPSQLNYLSYGGSITTTASLAKKITPWVVTQNGKSRHIINFKDEDSKKSLDAVIAEFKSTQEMLDSGKYGILVKKSENTKIILYIDTVGPFNTKLVEFNAEYLSKAGINVDTMPLETQEVLVEYIASKFLLNLYEAYQVSGEAKKISEKIAQIKQKLPGVFKLYEARIMNTYFGDSISSTKLNEMNISYDPAYQSIIGQDNRIYYAYSGKVYYTAQAPSYSFTGKVSNDYVLENGKIVLKRKSG